MSETKSDDRGQEDIGPINHFVRAIYHETYVLVTGAVASKNIYLILKIKFICLTVFLMAA